MKKFLLFSSLLVTSFGFSQITIFQDSFDTYNDFIITNFPANTWQTLDIDLLNTYVGGGPATNPGWTATWANAGAPQAFMVFNPATALVVNATNGVDSEAENRNFNPRTGSKYMASWGGVPSSNGQTAIANDDWLVSPVINLAGATGSALSIWVKSLSDTYGLEKYKIGVYVGTGTPTSGAQFTYISGVPNLTAPYPNWGERTQSLSAYDGQQIRIGIQCRSTDVYMFMVDDFKITAASLATESFIASKFSVTPNPANNFINISNTESINVNGITITDLNGRVVKNVSYGNVSDIQINVSDLASGMYILNIKSDLGTAIKKIVKN